ncbi:MAG: DUF5615 family PIN-like protein [Saprospiraceae bacterium]
MRILLDENLPRKLKADFGSDYDVKTVREMGWQGTKNGALLALIELHGFDFFVTIDKNLRYQQNLDRAKVSIFIMMAHNNRKDTLEKFIPEIINRIKSGDYEKKNEVY